MEIMVLGPGCPKCHETEKIVRMAADESGRHMTITKVADFAEIAKLGIFATPAVIVDGVVACSGRVPSKAEVAAWIAK